LRSAASGALRERVSLRWCRQLRRRELQSNAGHGTTMRLSQLGVEPNSWTQFSSRTCTTITPTALRISSRAVALPGRKRTGEATEPARGPAALRYSPGRYFNAVRRERSAPWAQRRPLTRGVVQPVSPRKAIARCWSRGAYPLL